MCFVTQVRPFAQIPWANEFEHETARELFGSNLLTLTWIKGEPMPGKLVEEVLRGLGLERETETQALLRRRSGWKRSTSFLKKDCPRS